ncbi:MAG: HTTM domain-containing protein [Labilithrix sp.]|nr:HTTM domain-containing protein [Labilithrix sp.]
MLAALARFRDELEDGYVLGPVRAAVGALLGWHALVAAEELAKIGYFGDTFHVAMIPEALVPAPRVYAVVLAARVCLAVMVAIGVWARPALAVSAALGLWLLLCDRNQFHHNRYSLYAYALLLSLTPCDRSWRATEPAVPAPRLGPWWGVRLAQLQVSLVYLASGGSKLLDPDWRDGLVLGDRIARYAHVAIAKGVPPAVVDLLARPDVASATAKLAIMTELVLCIALWLRPTRVVALWWGVWFHVVIQATSKVETFSVLALSLYGVFVTPDYRARRLRFDPSRFWGKLAGVVVPALDWFARFQVEPWEPDDQRGHSVVLVRRDGERATGVRAVAMIARCVPLLFPLWAPIALLTSFTRRGDLTTRG